MAKKIELTAQLIKNFAKKSTNRQHYVVSRILIVCEGEKTEPNYFKAFHQFNNGIFVVDLDFDGGGVNTIQVVDIALKLKKKAEKKHNPYDAVWAVFDRDSFKPVKFNAAISKAEANQISCAWSNEAFELWYLLHFEYRNTPMSRCEYWDTIARHINQSPLYKKKKAYKYKKNDENHYVEMGYYGDVETAIRNAKRLNELWENDTHYARHNPRTLVYKLVCQLLGKDKRFNQFIKSKMGE